MHWTYRAREQDSDLEQGDIILPTPELRGILEDVHPHFLDDKYVGFAVLTQSCDLVRRKRSAKTPYVAIATIRFLQQIFPQLLVQLLKPAVPGLFLTSQKLKVREFLERLFNQNEQALGLFYLHPDLDVGIADPAVVCLRVSVALRSEHYEVLQAARRGGLDDPFGSKFGWLIGNLYSRAATPDWSDKSGSADLRALIDQFMDPAPYADSFAWVDQEILDAARQRKVDLGGMDFPGSVDALEQYRPPDVRAQLIDAVLADVKAVAPLDAEAEDRIRNTLKNSPAITRTLRRAALRAG